MIMRAANPSKAKVRRKKGELSEQGSGRAERGERNEQLRGLTASGVGQSEEISTGRSRREKEGTHCSKSRRAAWKKSEVKVVSSEVATRRDATSF